MFRKAVMTMMLVFTSSIIAELVSAPQAAAERYFDYSTRQWVDYDPAKRMRYKKPPPAKYKRRVVSISTKQPVGSIIIDTDRKFLFHITSPGRATRYGVGVGREGFGWNGAVKIQRKQKWPTWTPPAEMRARERRKGIILPASMKGGVDNPLGARALYLYRGNADTMYRIHGTNQPWTIGLNMSSGCIRMVNKDVEHLYERAKIGTKVTVIGPGRDPTRVYTQGGVNPLSVLFGG